MIVSELISKLKEFNQDKTVIIEDADTNWLLHLTKIEEWKDIVLIGGTYRDEYNDEEGIQ